MKNLSGNFKLTVCSIFVAFLLIFLSIPSVDGASKKGMEASFSSAGLCSKCHREIYEYWSKSLHKNSVDDPVFQAAYLEAYKITEGEAKKICTRCHAPTTLLTKDYAMEGELAREGVTCDFCHSVKELKLGSEGYHFVLEVGEIKRGPLHPSKKAVKGHKVEFSQLHTTAEFCAGCHEYRNEEGVLLLGTFSEWKQSSYAREGTTCQFCHMAEVPVDAKVLTGKEKSNGRRVINRHDVSGGHSIPMLEKAVAVKIFEVEEKADKVRVIVEVTNKGSGHMVPTGIPSRMLVLNVSLKTDRGLVLTNQRIYKKTMLDEEGNELTRDSLIFLKSTRIASDTRLSPGEKRRENFFFVLPRGKPVEVKATVSYLYKPLLLEEGRMEVEMSSDSSRILK